MKRTSAFGLPARAVLRFRRWSRKRYAAFASLHRTVTMGCLAAHVADRLQQKQQLLQAVCSLVNTESPEDSDEERINREPEGMNLFFCQVPGILTAVQARNAAAPVAAAGSFIDKMSFRAGTRKHRDCASVSLLLLFIYVWKFKS